MGRPPLSGQPAFRFLQTEIADMEKALEESKGANPPRETIFFLAEKFSASPERLGKITVQWKQIWNWFQNRRHAQRAKSAKMTVNLNAAPSSYDDSNAKSPSTNSSAALSEDTGLLLLDDQGSKGDEDTQDRAFPVRHRGRGRGRGRGRSHSQVGREDMGLLVLEDQRSKDDAGLLLLEDQRSKGEQEDTPDRAFAGRHRGRGRGRGRGRNHSQVGRGRKAPDSPKMEFEARSARDIAWYDVAGFLTQRMLEPDDPEVQVRFAGFGAEEDEWVNVRRSVRRRSLPCEVSECIAVLPGDLILCFQEGKTQALYYDAHVLDVQRRQHDLRGCRCRFLVRYDHDQSEEVVPLRKVCRRPETDFRLQALHASQRSLPIEYGESPQQIEGSPPSKDCLVMLQVAKCSGDPMDPNNQHAGTETASMDIADDKPISVIPLQYVSDTTSILNEKISKPSTSPSMTQILDSNTSDVEMKPADQ